MDPFPQVLPVGSMERLSELERINAYAERCLLRADYFAYRGALLVSLGRGVEAIEVLERALLLAPDSPGLQFDYAQALAQGGNRQSASALLSLLLDRTDLHPDFRGLLEIQKKELLEQQWRFGFQLSSLFGHETNLNSAPDSRLFTFTTSAGDVVLELDPASQPMRGMGWLNSFTANGVTDLGAGQAVHVSGDLRSRQSGGDTDYLQAEGSVIWRGPRFYSLSRDGYQPDLRLGLSRFEFGGKTLFRGLRGEAGLEAPLEVGLGACRVRAGFVAEERRFPDSPASDGRYYGATLGTQCFHNQQRLGFQLSHGKDRPDGEFRPGGTQVRSEVGIDWLTDYGHFATHVIGAYSWAADSEPYSPLLGRGATRATDRLFAKLEIWAPLTGSWHLLVSIEQTRQDSNLELFAISNRTIYSGLRMRFD